MKKKPVALLTQQLLKKKLSSWVLSAHTTEVLGFTPENSAQIKQELLAFCDKGLVEKEGVRRGLKFKYVGNSSEETEESAGKTNEDSEVIDTVHVAGDMLAYVKQKKHDVDTLLTTGKEFSDLLKYLTLSCAPAAESSIVSYTMAIKHTADGIYLRMYSGIVLQYERLLTVDKFLKYIAASGVQFNVEKAKSPKSSDFSKEPTKILQEC